MRTIKRLMFLTILSTLAFGQLFINEIDYDQPSMDATEYVEIAGPAGTYTNVRLEHINGNGDALIISVDIASLTLSDESGGYGFYVIGASIVENVDNTPAGWPTVNIIQNGPDAIVLKLDNVIIDAVSYEGNMTDADGNVMENAGEDIALTDASYSLSRLGLNGSSWAHVISTPGVVNISQSFIPSPQFGTLTLTPTVPTEEDAVSVCIVITDPDGTVESAVMTYSVDGGAGTDVALVPVYCGENTWGGVIPAQAASSLVELTVLAIDNDANESVSQTYSYMVMSSAGQTIYDIQFNDSDVGSGCYDSPLNGQTVTFSGIITASGTGNYFIQDGTGAWNGVYVYDSGNSAVIGDDVTLVAVVDEYYGLTEIKDVTSYTINSSGNTLPAPTLISTGDLAGGCSATGEAYEGVLVQLTNVTVTSEADSYGQWFVDDGTGACEVEDKYFAYTPEVGEVFTSITGVVDYGYSEYALCPRDDLDLNSGSPVFENQTFSPEFVSNANQIEIAIDIIPGADDQTITSATIMYGTDGTLLNESVMWLDNGNTWMGDIPAQAANSFLEYQIAVVTNDSSEYVSHTYKIAIASSDLTEIATIQANPVVGQVVTVEGIITIGGDLLHPPYTKAYIQDGSGHGINLFEFDPIPLNRGDLVKAVGIIGIEGTTVEIKNFSYQLISTGNALPEPVILTPGQANLAEWEGTLLQITGTITDSWSAGGGLNLEVGNDTDTTLIRIWESTLVDVALLNVGTDWSFMGVGSQYNGTFQLLVAYDADIVSTTGIVVLDTKPQQFALNPAYPNPFNPSTTLSWTLLESTELSIRVFDVRGREVAYLADGLSAAGHFSMNWNASDLSSGVYFIQLITPTESAIQKVMLVK